MSFGTTMKLFLRRTLVRSVILLSIVRQPALSLSKGSVHRSVILLNQAWQFILSIVEGSHLYVLNSSQHLNSNQFP